MIVVWILGGHLLGDATKEQVEKSVKIHQWNEGTEWYKYYIRSMGPNTLNSPKFPDKFDIT